MPLIANFSETSLRNAFILNAIVSSVIVITAVFMRSYITRFYHPDGTEIERKVNWPDLWIALLATFGASLVSYWIMYVFFGFGHSMVVKG